MSEKLKPCPFCGGTDLYENIHWVLCRSCNGHGPQISANELTMEGDNPAGVKWNRRVASPWATEPPTEEGWYLAYFHNAKLFSLVRLFENRGVIWVDAPGDLEHYNVPVFTSVYNVSWLKIDVPDPPEESEVTQ